MPELVQYDFTAENVVAELKRIVLDGADRDRMLEGLARVKARLRSAEQGTDARHPADRAADIIMALEGKAANVG